MKRLVCVFLGLLFATSAAFATTNTPWLKIETVGTGWEGENIYIGTDNSSTYEGCSNATYVVKSATHDMTDEILSLVLSALHTGVDVQIRVTGCFGNAMVVDSVTLRK